MSEAAYIKSVKVNFDRVPGNQYYKEIPSLRGLSELEIPGAITFFVGENGTGKSTLLEAVAVAYGFNPEGGSKNYSFSTRQTHSGLYECLTISRGWRQPRDGYFLRAESFYNVATKLEEYAAAGPGNLFADYGGRSLHEQSHGESFLALMQNRFWGEGLYILDEPEAALSPQRQLSLLATLYDLAAEGSQFIIATHSPILLGTPGAAILSFDSGEIRPVEYEDTDSYRVTEMFINDRRHFLDRLLCEHTT